MESIAKICCNSCDNLHSNTLFFSVVTNLQPKQVTNGRRALQRFVANAKDCFPFCSRQEPTNTKIPTRKTPKTKYQNQKISHTKYKPKIVIYNCVCVDACPKQLGDADHVAGYPINMHWEKKAQTPCQTTHRCSKIEIQKIFLKNT